MRIVIDSLIGLMLVGVVAVAFFLHRADQNDQQTIETVRQALSDLDEKTDYHTALKSAEQGKDALIVRIEEAWFGEAKPVNALLDSENPWIDLAPPGDLGVHPPDPVVTRTDQAGFWYNPTIGVFRARVTPQASEAKTLALYNQVNTTILPEFDPLPDDSRTPIAHGTGKAPALQYASMANQTWARPTVDPHAKPKAEQPTQTDVSSESDATRADDASDPNTSSQDVAQDSSAPGNSTNPDQPALETRRERPTLKR